jgi:hypothetical protein
MSDGYALFIAMGCCTLVAVAGSFFTRPHIRGFRNLGFIGIYLCGLVLPFQIGVV